ncbi:MAG: GreA/GreB family elongation factor [bacterium]|nr:GreA/GreB family elongation factor [bacterium]
MEGKTFYITKEKLKELQKEYDELVVLEHQKAIKEEAPKMLESEDVNPEFLSFQEDMSSMRARLEELKDIIEHHEIIKKPSKEKQALVDIGAKVKIDTAGKKDEFTIVGTLEADPDLGKISNESPVGKALLGHKIGDEILVSAPVKKKYKIKNIKYDIS